MQINGQKGILQRHYCCEPLTFSWQLLRDGKTIKKKKKKTKTKNLKYNSLSHLVKGQTVLSSWTCPISFYYSQWRVPNKWIQLYSKDSKKAKRYVIDFRRKKVKLLEGKKAV